MQLFTDALPKDQPHISEVLVSDILHQNIKGAFMDHYVVWVCDYIALFYEKKEALEIMDEIDRR
jgi:hypothetical protein